MKHLTYIIGMLLAGSLAVACSEEGFTTFRGEKAGIYIQGVSKTDINKNPLEFRDSTVFSFSAYESEVVDVNVPIPVCVMGNVTDYDRPFVLAVDESHTTAERGLHYDYDEATCVIPAGESKVSVQVTLFRSVDLQQKSVCVELVLKDNDQFTVELEQYKNVPDWTALGDTLCGSRYRIIFNDMMSITTWWEWYGQDIYGDWSASKEKRINNIMGWTHQDWESWDVPYGQMGYAAKKLRDELQELADAGTPVIDDDGSYMQLNPPYEVDYSAYE